MRRKVYHSAVYDMLVGLLGPERTARLLDRYGGRRLYIPASDRSALVGLVGADGLARLREAFGSGCYVRLPEGRLEIDRDAVVRLRLSGLSSMKVARLVGCSTRTVERIVRQDLS